MKVWRGAALSSRTNMVFMNATLKTSSKKWASIAEEL